MATVQGTLGQPETGAGTAIQRVAAEHGYAPAHGERGGGWIVFRKGASAFSC